MKPLNQGHPPAFSVLWSHHSCIPCSSQLQEKSKHTQYRNIKMFYHHLPGDVIQNVLLSFFLFKRRQQFSSIVSICNNSGIGTIFQNNLGWHKNTMFLYFFLSSIAGIQDCSPLTKLGVSRSNKLLLVTKQSFFILPCHLKLWKFKTEVTVNMVSCKYARLCNKTNVIQVPKCLVR